MNVDGKWTFNETCDGEWVEDLYDTREEAIVAGREEYPDQGFYVGQCEQIKVPTEADADHTLELISSRIDDLYGGCDVNFIEYFYSTLTKEMKAELQRKLEAVVKEWIEEHKICEGCFVIRGTERIAAGNKL